MATLIIALGLLVDDPVVAGDSIKRALADRHPRSSRAWLGPTKLATRHPLRDDHQHRRLPPIPRCSTARPANFIYSLPIVMTCALVASRLVSMTFIPLLGYYLLRAQKEASKKSPEERRTQGFTRLLLPRRQSPPSSIAGWSFAGSAGVPRGRRLLRSPAQDTILPRRRPVPSFLDVWLPNDVPLLRHQQSRRYKSSKSSEPPPKNTARTIPTKTAALAKSCTRHHLRRRRRPALLVLRHAAAPAAQLRASHHEVDDKDDTPRIVDELQRALSDSVPGARIDVRQLQTNPVDYPVEIRVTGQADISALDEAQDIADAAPRSHRKSATSFARVPKSARVRNEWGKEGFQVTLKVDPDRANIAGVTNLDVAQSPPPAP